jgi:hypothetical protein
MKPVREPSSNRTPSRASRTGSAASPGKNGRTMQNARRSTRRRTGQGPAHDTPVVGPRRRLTKVQPEVNG